MKYVNSIFIGWQEQGHGFPPFALFNLIDENGHEGSTVTVGTLLEMNLEIPEHPSYYDWLLTVDRKEGLNGRVDAHTSTKGGTSKCQKI